MRKVIVILLLLLIALILGYFVGFSVRTSGGWSAGAIVFILITMAGAFGGMLYTARDDGLESPHRDPERKHVIRLGWVVDCGYGIAGAYVVFLILPTELTTTADAATSLLTSASIFGLVKLLAMALVGGYGGRSVVDRALANIAKEAEEAKKSAEEAKMKVDQIEVIDTQAFKLVNRHFDKNEEVHDVERLVESIKAASRPARFEIFKEARAIRKDNWRKDVPFMERTIPVFEALINNNAGEEFHRNYGQLGYALKDKGGDDDAKKDWQGAYSALSTAISLRDRDGETGYLLYEFNRAICAIKLNKEFDVIAADLRAAARRSSLHNIMKREAIFADWAARNNFNLDTLQRE